MSSRRFRRAGGRPVRKPPLLVPERPLFPLRPLREEDMPGLYERIGEILATGTTVYTLPPGPVGYVTEIRDLDSGATASLHFPEDWDPADVINMTKVLGTALKNAAETKGSDPKRLPLLCAYIQATCEYTHLAMLTPKGSA